MKQHIRCLGIYNVHNFDDVYYDCYEQVYKIYVFLTTFIIKTF